MKTGISNAMFYNWQKKFGSIRVSEIQRLNTLKEKSWHLKKLVADLGFDKHIFHDVPSKKFYSLQERGKPLNQKDEKEADKKL